MGGFDVMGKYELELVSQHPAQPAQTPYFPKPTYFLTNLGMKSEISI